MKRMRTGRGRLLAALAASAAAVAIPAMVLADLSGSGINANQVFIQLEGERIRGIEIAQDGDLLIAVLGTGNDDGMVIKGSDDDLDNVLAPGEYEVIAENLPSGGSMGEVTGVSEAIQASDGTYYAVVGEGPPAEEPAGEGEEPSGYASVWNLTEGTVLADIQAAIDQGIPGHDNDAPSNPYALVEDADGNLLVSDSSADAMFKVNTETGEVSLYATFPLVQTDPFPIPPVPTGVAWGPDGALYVAYLSGGPFIEGLAGVFRLEDEDEDGDALEEGELQVAATGLTMATDVSFDDEGRMVVSEFSLGFLEDPPLAGRIVRSVLSFNDTGEQGVGLPAPNLIWVLIAEEAATPTAVEFHDGDVFYSQEFVSQVRIVVDPVGYVEIFEGWNPLAWPGPYLEGDEIDAYLGDNAEGWLAMAAFTGAEWEQRFQDPPLPAFNTLTNLAQGQDYWLYVSDNGFLLVP